MRTEATGYGAMFFLRSMLEHGGGGMEGMRISISGSGNVAIHAAGEGSSAWRKAAYPVGFGRFHILRGRPHPGADRLDQGISRMCGEGRISEVADEFKSIEFHEGKAPLGRGGRLRHAIRDAERTQRRGRPRC